MTKRVFDLVICRTRLTPQEKHLRDDWSPCGPNRIQTEWTFYGFASAADIRAKLAEYGITFDPTVHIVRTRRS